MSLTTKEANQVVPAPTTSHVVDSPSKSKAVSDSKDNVKEETINRMRQPLEPYKLCLHDCLSLGEVELGLSTENRAGEEIQRLPLLLRLLSFTRPLSSVSIFDILKDDDKDEDKEGSDPLVNTVVARLEHVAATYSVAEGVDVVTCHLVPSISRKISKLTALQKRKPGGIEWDTAALVAVAKHPTVSRSKRRRLSTEDPSQDNKHDDDAIQDSSDLDDADEDDQPDEDNDMQVALEDKKRKRNTIQRRDSIGHDHSGAEDSQEATVIKTLSELASLVVSALEPLSSSVIAAAADTSEEAPESCQNKGQLVLTIDDSILSESARGSEEGMGGAMAGSDLGSTVAAIMHHAPVLRSRHVAVRSALEHLHLLASF